MKKSRIEQIDEVSESVLESAEALQCSDNQKRSEKLDGRDLSDLVYDSLEHEKNAKSKLFESLQLNAKREIIHNTRQHPLMAATRAFDAAAKQRKALSFDRKRQQVPKNLITSMQKSQG